jgi:hypothetical protein
MGINHREARQPETFHPFSITRNEGTMISIQPFPTFCNTEPALTPEFISRRNRAYSEIYEQICACNEEGVSCLLRAYQDVLNLANCFDLMQTCLCTIAAKKAWEAGAKGAKL